MSPSLESLAVYSICKHGISNLAIQGSPLLITDQSELVPQAWIPNTLEQTPGCVNCLLVGGEEGAGLPSAFDQEGEVMVYLHPALSLRRPGPWDPFQALSFFLVFLLLPTYRGPGLGAGGKTNPLCEYTHDGLQNGNNIAVKPGRSSFQISQAQGAFENSGSRVCGCDGEDELGQRSETLLMDAKSPHGSPYSLYPS